MKKENKKEAKQQNKTANTKKSEDVGFSKNVNKKFGNENIVYNSYTSKPATAKVSEILIAKMVNGNHGSDKFRTEILKISPCT